MLVTADEFTDLKNFLMWPILTQTASQNSTSYRVFQLETELVMASNTFEYT